MKLNQQLVKDLQQFRLMSLDQKLLINQPNFSEFVNYLSKVYNEKQLFEEIFHAIPCTISIINPDLTYHRVNNFLASMYKKDAAWFEGVEIGAMSADTRFKDFLTSFFASDLTAANFYLESHANNQNKYYYILAKKMTEHGVALVMGVDVTQVKLLEDQSFFDSKLKELGELSASIVHEINNPLSVISTCNELIAMEAEDVSLDSVQEHSKNVTKAIQQIGKIIKSLKNFMYNRTEFIKFKLDELLSQVDIITLGKLKKNKVSLSWDIDSETREFVLLANDVQLTQVLVNLINNAVDAIKDLPQKWIKVKVRKEGGVLKISIIDSGAGIPDEIAAKIFDKFYSTKPQGEGTGLGLSIVNKIIENHKGKISLIKGENTEFEIQLPIE